MELRVAIEPGPELEIAALHFDERGLAAEQSVDDTALASDVFAQPEPQICGFRFELAGKPSPAKFFVQILGHDRRPPSRGFRRQSDAVSPNRSRRRRARREKSDMSERPDESAAGDRRI